MTKIDIISGFLGAGKTTFIKKLLKEAIAGEKVGISSGLSLKYAPTSIFSLTVKFGIKLYI